MQLKKYIYKAIVITIQACTLFLLSGCYTFNTSSNTAPCSKEGFACNAWEDTNNDYIPNSAEEFIGKKKSFDPNESLMLVSILSAPNIKGKTWSIKITSDTGKEIMNQSHTIPSDHSIIRIGGTDENLAGWISSKYGAGIYQTAWYIDDELMCSCAFTLTNPQYRIGQGSYIMGSKEKLTDVSRRFEVDVSDILLFNNIRDPRQVSAGQKIVLWPTVTEYITKKGEWLSKIARDHNTSVAIIKKINGLKSDTLKPGQKLFIPTDSHQ